MFNRIKNSPFFRNALLLTLGTSFAQLIQLLIYPILSRVYGPEQFGILAVFTSIVSILTVLFTGKYENAIFVSKKNIDAANLLSLSLSLAICIFIISLLIFVLFSGFINQILKVNIGFWLYFAPLSAIFICVFNCYNEWCVRCKYYPRLALNKITNSCDLVAAKYLFSLTSYNSYGLILGDIFGRLITAISCIYNILKKDYRIFKFVTFSQILNQAIIFRDFPKYTLPAQLLNTIGVSTPVLIMSIYFSGDEIGFFSVTMSVLSVPITTISYSVKDVFRQKANEIFVQTGDFRYLYVKVLKILSLITISVCSFVFFFLPSLFSIVFGDEWVVAGEYAQILLPMIGINFVAMSMSGVLIIADKLRVNFFWQLYYSIISILSIIIGCFIFDSIYHVLIVFCFARISAYIALIFLSYKYSKKN